MVLLLRIYASRDSNAGKDNNACKDSNASKDSDSIAVIGRAKRAPHCGVQSRFRVIYICIYMCVSVCLVCQINCVGGIT